jgi:hypothetical protein
VARAADRLTAALAARGRGPDYLVTLEVRLEEVAPEGRAPVLKAYLERAPNARTHVPVDKDAPLEEFERVAPRLPVFRVVPRDTLRRRP